MTSLFDTVQRCVDEERPVAAATIIGGASQVGARMLVFDDGATEGGLGDRELEERVRADALTALRRGAPRRASYPNPNPGGEPTDVFLDVYPSPPTLLIFGGVHIGVPL